MTQPLQIMLSIKKKSNNIDAVTFSLWVQFTSSTSYLPEGLEIGFIHPSANHYTEEFAIQT